ncbi:hypothetical protein FB451DRAFT_1369605 [Mycena latifolia]|nr:hypothetical protein FB451DRAFT_1369605 [Mycena latifolia]
MSAAQFTTQLFESTSCQKDAAKAISTFEADVAADAKITAVPQGHQGLPLHRIRDIDLAAGDARGYAARGNAAVVALIVRAKHTLNAGTTQNMVSVSIIKIEEKGGKQVVTSWVENQERTPA